MKCPNLKVENKSKNEKTDNFQPFPSFFLTSSIEPKIHFQYQINDFTFEVHSNISTSFYELLYEGYAISFSSYQNTSWLLFTSTLVLNALLLGSLFFRCFHDMLVCTLKIFYFRLDCHQCLLDLTSNSI